MAREQRAASGENESWVKAGNGARNAAAATVATSVHAGIVLAMERTSRLYSLLVAVVLLPGLSAQDPELPRIVQGSVRDEAGAPIAGAMVRIEVCNGPHVAGALAELRHDPLPRARSTSEGRFTLVMAPVHDRFDWTIHGQLALVVEVPGRQTWRELLPNPPRLYDGSDVVLPRLRGEDRATIRVPDAPPGALVMLRRTAAKNFLQAGGPPGGECYLLPVPVRGELGVHVPLLPNPATVPQTSSFAITGWTAQLVFPGATSAPLPLTPGAKIELARAMATFPRAMRDAVGNRVPVARCLHRMPDDTLRWFPSVGGEVVEDEQLPLVAVELAEGAHKGVVIGERTVPVLGDAPRKVHFFDDCGEAVMAAHIACYAPADLVWNRVGAPRPAGPPHEEHLVEDGELALPAAFGERTSAWITAPGFQARFVLDLRTLPADGRVELHPAPKQTRIQVVDSDNKPLAGVRLYASGEDGLAWAADGEVPRSDAEGVCTIATTSDWPMVVGALAGYQFGGLEGDGGGGSFRLVGRRWHLFAARTVDNQGAAVPFVNVGYEIWQFHTDGTSSGTSVTATSDSRGFVHLFGDPDRPPRVQPGELGHYPDGGTRLALGGITDVVVHREPLVALQTMATTGWGHFSLPWHGVGRTVGGVASFAPYDGHALLLRWPLALPVFAYDVDGGPPVALSRDEAQRASLQVIDRRSVVRRTPLQLTGAVPLDLGPLRARAAAIAGHELNVLSPLEGEYLGPARTPDALVLDTRDFLAHDVWLLHPDVLPVKVTIAAGAGCGEPVSAALSAGAPCTLHIRLQQPVPAHTPPGLIVRKSGLFGGKAWFAALTDARMHEDAVTKGIEVRAPFALPTGRLQLALENCGCAPVELTVSGTGPVRAEFAPKQ